MGFSKLVVMFFFFFLILIIEGCWRSEGCLEHEKFALLQLRHFFNDPLALRNWVDDENNSDCCQWEGIDCSNTTRRVISLELYANGNWKSTEKWYLNASLFIPFQQLEELYLGNNKIAGCVENEGLEKLSKLSNLKILYLAFNYFNNSILPSIGNLSSLRELSLSVNELKGSIDVKEWDSLNNLEELYMGWNEIDKFVAPKGLSKLRYLSLSDNRLNGSFDIQELDLLINLEVLDMSFNEIHDLVVPKDYRGLRKLKSLDLSRVGIRDGSKLIKSMGSFPSLKTLYLSYNNFTKIMTATQGLCDLVHLQELHIDDCNLRGILPGCLANMTSLRVLDVSSNQLTGKISLSPLMHLTSIEELDLSNNHLQIPISLEPFFNHSKLKSFQGGSNELYSETESHSLGPKFQLNTIDLSDCGNIGTFPKFLYQQRELQEVELSHNNLTEGFPIWLLENNTKLERLYLVNNSLSGPLQMPNHSHRQLSKLDVSKNKFRGNIPAEIRAYLPNLRSLNFSTNDLNGSIPSSFGDMKYLESLDLSNNHLTGEIPEHMAMGCFNLNYLVLSNNNLQGHLFSKNFNLTHLQRLQLDDNHFIGMIPESLSNCSSLGGLYLSDNNFSGKIPTWLGNLSLLEDIIMPNNHLEGPIPKEFCQLHNLQILDISKNNISGNLPSCFSFSSIKQVHLSENMLHGPLKDGTLFNSSSLITLDLSNNRLNGSIPDWIEKLTQLSYLILANNNLEGELPIQLCQVKKLRLIDLSHNNLYGHIPPCLDNTSLHEGFNDSLAPTYIPSSSSLRPYYSGISMGKEETIVFTVKERTDSYHGNPLNCMYGIDLSYNQLSGEIPPQVGELTRIRALNLSHNNLTGTIPTTFSSLKRVESLDLSYNNLNGKIPSQLVELTFLVDFSVAHNNLSGKIPEWTAQFALFNETSYMGNHFLCGRPVLKSCNENGSSTLAGTPQASTSKGEDDSLIDIESFYITFTVSYVIVILGIVGVLCVNPYWRRRWFYLVEIWMTYCYYFLVDNLIPTRFYHRYM